MLEGSAVVVLDVETARSADECRHCRMGEGAHGFHGLCETAALRMLGCRYSKIGWKNHAALGLSIGCYFDYQDGLYHWFDGHTLPALVSALLQRQPLLVSFNGRQFDGPLMMEVCAKRDYATTWQYLWDRSYDILAEIWYVDPDRKFERGLNSLDALAQANDHGAKAMDGTMAPRLWQQGRYAEVIEYCRGDVTKTKQLFEQIVATGQILRGDGQPIALPLPLLPGLGTVGTS